MKNLSQKISGKLKKRKVCTIHNNVNKFNNFIRIGKDRFTTNEERDFVYKINRKNCHPSYISQTDILKSGRESTITRLETKRKKMHRSHTHTHMRVCEKSRSRDLFQ